jgi:hypothetical protein
MRGRLQSQLLRQLQDHEVALALGRAVVLDQPATTATPLTQATLILWQCSLWKHLLRYQLQHQHQHQHQYQHQHQHQHQLWQVAGDARCPRPAARCFQRCAARRRSRCRCLSTSQCAASLLGQQLCCLGSPFARGPQQRTQAASCKPTGTTQHTHVSGCQCARLPCRRTCWSPTSRDSSS